MSAPLTWDELDDADPEDFTDSHDARPGSPSAATSGPPFYAEPPGTPRRALELYARDERELGTGQEGGAEMPYPPDYPKMPGEPPRVQPSRKNEANWA